MKFLDQFITLLTTGRQMLGITVLTLSSCLWAASSRAESAPATPSFLTVNGIGIPVDVEGTPHFGWHVATTKQTAYQIMVSSTAAKASAGEADIWDSGKTRSSAQNSIAYHGPTLKSAWRYFWTVRTWDDTETVSARSPVAAFGTGPGTHWEAVPIWTKATHMPWTDYVIETALKIESLAAGIQFRVTGTGNAYLWKFDAVSNTLTPYKQVDGHQTALKTVALPAGMLAPGKRVNIKISVVGSTIKTWIDDIPVNTTVDRRLVRGGIGLASSKDASASFSRLKVTDAASGTSLLITDFPNNDDTFSCGHVSDRALTISNGQSCVQRDASQDWAFLRGQVQLADKPIAWASLFATASSPKPARQYVYKLYLNGHFIGLGPTQSTGDETRYDGFDVTKHVVPGARIALGALAYTTADQRFQAELVVRYTDGTSTVFGTGPQWTGQAGNQVYPAAGSVGSIVYALPVENLDLRRWPVGFTQPGFTAGWPAAVVKPSIKKLIATPTNKVSEQRRRPVSVFEKGPGHYFVDFGRTWVGGVHYRITNGIAGKKVELRFGEITSAAHTVRDQLNTGNHYEDVVTTREGQQIINTWGSRVFRYLEIVGAPEPVTADNLQALALVYPFDADASAFDASDPELVNIYNLSKHTIEALNVNFYVDSWTRERLNYEADAYLQQMSSMYLMDDLSLARYSMNHFRDHRTWPTEWPLYVILAVYEAWQQTGDTTELADYYPNLKQKLERGWLDPTTGLIRKTTGSDGRYSRDDDDIVDWPTGERDGYQFREYNTLINAMFYRAYRDMAAIAAQIGQSADAATYNAIAERMRAAINQRLFDPAKGVYDDGMDAHLERTGHNSLHANAFALAFGVPTAQQAPEVAAYVASRGMACSVYCAAFLIKGLYEGGQDQAALNMLTQGTGIRSWLNMIKAGAGATMEAWDASLKPNLTYSHPWAASPAFNIPAELFGIQPTTPGYASFQIKPQPGKLSWATIHTPTVRGSIGVGFERNGDHFTLAAQVPGNSTATIYIPTTISASTSLYVDGRSQKLARQADFIVVPQLSTGCHVLSTRNDRLSARLAAVCTAPQDR